MDPDDVKGKSRSGIQKLEKASVLVIDDDEAVCESCRQILEDSGFRASAALHGAEGIRLAEEVRPNVVLVDLKMPGMGGMEVIQKILDLDPSIVPIVITGYGTVDSAVESMKLGAFDFLAKPFEPEKLVQSVRRGVKLSQLRQESKGSKAMPVSAEKGGPSKQDVLLKGLSLLSESYSAGFDRTDFMEELSRLEQEAKYHADLLGKAKAREKAILDVVHELRLVDEIISKHDYQKSALIQILLDTQSALRWLPRHALKWISERLKVPLGDIYSIATFYEAFSLTPQGAHSVQVCMGTACHVRGAPDLLRKTSALLGIEEGQTDDKQMFTLKTVHCLGCCALSPVVQIDEAYFSNPSLKELKKVFESLEAEEVHK